MGFEFSGKNTMVMEICGQTYEIDPFSEGAMKSSRDFRRRVSEVVDGDGATPENVADLCAIAGDALDDILGAGSYAAIFQGRAPNLLDHIEVVTHVTASVMAFRQKRITQFTADGLAAARDVLVEGLDLRGHDVPLFSVPPHGHA